MISTGIQAQLISESQWFFGNSTYNLQSDKNGDIVYLEERMATPFGIGGPVVINSPYTGNLIFYSDGQRIYDASHQLIADDLTGNPAINRAAVAARVPNSVLPDGSERYYIITNSGNNGPNQIQYTEVDPNRIGNGTIDAPLGEVVNRNNPTDLDNPSEAMIVVQDSARTRQWLITQNRETFDFRVSQVVIGGIDAAQVYELDTLTRPGFEAASFAFNPDSSLLAIAPKDPNRNIWLANFNPGTGELSFNSVIRNTGFADDQNESVYDVEWSPDGSKLYFSRFGASTNVANLYQFDLNDSLETVSEILDQPIYRSLGLRTGLNDNIYHLYQANQGGAIQIGMLSNADSLAENTNYEAGIFEEDFVARQFPDFATPPLTRFDLLQFTWLDSCQNDFTKFFPTVSPTPTSYFWDFGAAGNSNAVAPIVQIEPPGTVVTLTVELNGVTQSLTQTVPIIENQSQLSILDQNQQNVPQDTVICIDEILRLTAQVQPDQGAQFLWNNGTTGPTIDVDTTGTYWVEATFPNGCTAFSSVNVTEYGITSQIANQWYFGERAGIDFNQNPPEGISDANVMFSAEGCATISDENGQLLFYTNGETIWNRDHQIMSNGTNLGGNNEASQGVVILPFANDQTMYYVFSINATDDFGEKDMTYAIVDMKEDLGLGAVVLKRLPYFEHSIGKVTNSGFQGAYWIMGHEFGNNTFRANLVTDEGIGPTFFTPAGTVLAKQDPSLSDGYMKLHPGGQNFTNVISGNSTFEIFDFLDSLGGRRIFNPRLIDSEESTPLYGLEFEGDGLAMYLSTGDRLIGYLLDSLGTDNEIQDIIDTKIDGPTGAGFGAIQTGPNGQIYLAIDNSQTVGSITLGADRDLINLNATAIDINPDNTGRLSRLGLPNFILNSGSPIQQPGLIVEDACLGQGTPLEATGSSNIDQYQWEIFDPPGVDRSGGPAESDSINVTYDTTGIFDISVRVFNRCATERQGTGPQQGETLSPLAPPFSIDTTLFDEVEVNPLPDLPVVPDDTSLCNGPLILAAFPDSTRPDLIYNWSTGDTTRTITITEPAVIDISITNQEGCSSDTLQTFIADGRPQIDLGPDQDVCQFEPFPDLDAQNTQVFYQWSIDSLEANETRFQPVNTDTTGVFTYAIQVIEPRNECAGSDTIQITVRETPEVTTDFSPPSECGISDASIAFDINSDGSFLYSFINPDTALVDNLDGPIAGPNITDLGIGTYNLRVENLVTGCTFNESLFVENDVPFDLTASNLPDCNTDVSLQLTLTGTQLPERANVYVTTATNDTLFSQTNRRPPFLFSPNLEDGEYFVTVTDASNGCAQVDSVLIQPFIPGPGDCLPAILAPNAFSPNGNSANEEFFIIPNPYIGDFEIYIYTRWGELVYFSEDISFRWDGTYNNKVLPVGTYAYVIRFTSIEDPNLGEQVQYGSVTLVR